jgi:hypothetical protein
MAIEYSDPIRGDSAEIMRVNDIPLTTPLSYIYHPTLETNWSRSSGTGIVESGDDVRIFNWLWSYPEGVTWDDMLTMRFDFEARSNTGFNDLMDFNIRPRYNTGTASWGRTGIADAEGIGWDPWTPLFVELDIKGSVGTWDMDQAEFEELIAGDRALSVWPTWGDFYNDDFEIRYLYMTLSYTVPGDTRVFLGYGSF